MWQIARNLYLGDGKDAHDVLLLEGLGITHILNCALEIPCWYPERFVYLHLELSDPDPEFHEYIEGFCKFIRRGRRRGGVLVHCAAGLNRSPSAIVAYLCSLGKTVDQALDILQKRVGETNEEFFTPDASFLEQISVHFED